MQHHGALGPDHGAPDAQNAQCRGPDVWDTWGLVSGAWGSAHGAQHMLDASFSVHDA